MKRYLFSTFFTCQGVSNGGEMVKWRCLICQYIHVGDTPPDICPVCSAGKDKFVKVDEEDGNDSDSGEKNTTNEKSPQKGLYSLLTDTLAKHHAHPISVHVPNGVIPIAVVFVIIAFFMNVRSLMEAAHYNTIVIVLSLPVVLFTGFVEWQKKYNGALTKFFIIKIICGIIVFISSTGLVLWYYFQPEIFSSTQAGRWLYLLVNVFMLVGAGIAGFIGGKLVFKD
jgi:rubredoxin/uncharacterized membrane protein